MGANFVQKIAKRGGVFAVADKQKAARKWADFASFWAVFGPEKSYRNSGCSKLVVKQFLVGEKLNFSIGFLPKNSKTRGFFKQFQMC